MNRVLSNIQYMPSPNGQSKRLRYSNSDPEFDQSDNSIEDKENINSELFKTTHVYTGDLKLTKRGHVFPLQKRGGDSVSVLSNEPLQTGDKSLLISFDDCSSLKKFVNLQSGRYLLNGTRRENLTDDTNCGFASDKFVGIDDVASIEYVTECSNNSSVIGQMTSDFAPRYHRKRPLDNEQSEIEQKTNIVPVIPADCKTPANSSTHFSNEYTLHLSKNEIKTSDKTKQCVVDGKASAKLNQQNRVKEYKVNCVFRETGKITKDKSKQVLKLAERSSRQTYVQIVKRLPDYQQFSNIFHKALWNTKRPKTNFEDISPAKGSQLKLFSCNIVETKLPIDKNTTKKLKLKMLQDMDELEEFLDYVNSKISELVLVIRSIKKDIQLLEVETEDISVALHYIDNTQFFDETAVVTSTRKEMRKLGKQLLKRIKSLEDSWGHILKTYKYNLVIVSRSLYLLCSMPIETNVIKQRDSVFDNVSQIDKLIQNIELKEQELDYQRACNYSEFMELEKEIAKFNGMDSLLDDIN